MDIKSLTISLVLISAFTRAAWNVHVKKSDNTLVFVSLMVVPQFFVALFLVFLAPLPPTSSFIYLIASSLVQTIYIILLSIAYQHGLVSRVYPIATGSASLLSLLFWHVYFKESLSILQEWGVVLLSFGIIGFSLAGKRDVLNIKGITYAFITSFFVLAYSLIDTFGIRTDTNPLSYISWLFLIKALMLFLPLLALHKISLYTIVRHNKNYIVAGLLAGFGYGVAIWAFSHSATPIILALRSTSVVFVFLLSIFYLKEKASSELFFLTPLIALGVFLVLAG